MTLDRLWPRFAAIVGLAVVLACAAPALVRAGGTGFGDDDDSAENEGPSYFGFVREEGGAGIADAKVTAELKDRGALVTRTDIMGVYKIPGFGKDINPDDVSIACAKDGYKQASVERHPHPADDSKDPVEIECYLKKN
jgi:hypothetical protein